MTFATLLGTLAGLGAAQILTITEADWANLSLFALIGGLVAFLLYILVIGPYQLVKRERSKHHGGEPYVVMNFHDQVNVNYTFPGGRQVPSGSNTLIRSPYGEGLLVPPGTIPSEFTANAEVVKPYEPPPEH